LVILNVIDCTLTPYLWLLFNLIVVLDVDLPTLQISHQQPVWHEQFGGKSTGFDFVRIAFVLVDFDDWSPTSLCGGLPLPDKSADGLELIVISFRRRVSRSSTCWIRSVPGSRAI
jgi:hypothetical protein